MGQETIGSVTEWEPGYDTDWAYETACRFLAAALGDPPSGTSIKVGWQDHELGSYPAIIVSWKETAPYPAKFIRDAENALLEFDDAVDWHRIRPSNFLFCDEE